MMVERALLKQSELNSYIQDLGLEADASKRVPAADVLTSDDWKVRREVRYILEPIYHMTMRTQGWGTSRGHGRLWEVMTGMEFILDHLEDWKALYGERPAHVVDDGKRSPPWTPTQLRERPSRQPRLPSRLQGCELLTPLRHHSQMEASVLPTTERCIDAVLPAHSRSEYVQGDARSVSSIASMRGQSERA
jgi:hypothetical protein